MSFVQVGNPIPVAVQLGDGFTGKFVQAIIVDNNGTPVVGSPVSLTEIANGLYMDSSLSMPTGIHYVVVQATSYNDSGHIVPSDDYIAAKVFSTSESDGGGIPINSPVPVAAQLGDGNNDLFLRGIVYDPAGNVLATLALIKVVDVDGLYQNSSYLMPDVPFVVVQTAAYTDSDFTVPADQLISSIVYTNLAANPNPLPVCPTDLTISVVSFKAYFTRDFPYGNTPSYVMDSDISKAIIQATCFVNKALFCTPGTYAQGVLTLAAHFLVMNLRASAQGIQGTYPWMTVSKAVGNVSEGIQIPDRIMANPQFAMLTKTYYGSQFLFSIMAKLTGQMFTVAGTTLP